MLAYKNSSAYSGRRQSSSRAGWPVGEEETFCGTAQHFERQYDRSSRNIAGRQFKTRRDRIVLESPRVSKKERRLSDEASAYPEPTFTVILEPRARSHLQLQSPLLLDGRTGAPIKIWGSQADPCPTERLVGNDRSRRQAVLVCTLSKLSGCHCQKSKRPSYKQEAFLLVI